MIRALNGERPGPRRSSYPSYGRMRPSVCSSVTPLAGRWPGSCATIRASAWARIPRMSTSSASPPGGYVPTCGPSPRSWIRETGQRTARRAAPASAPRPGPPAGHRRPTPAAGRGRPAAAAGCRRRGRAHPPAGQPGPLGPRHSFLGALRSPAYDQLLDALVNIASQPPHRRRASWTGWAASRRHSPRLDPAALAPAETRSLRALRSNSPDTEWHAVRIRAKHCRYAAEAVAPVYGRPGQAVRRGHCGTAGPPRVPPGHGRRGGMAAQRRPERTRGLHYCRGTDRRGTARTQQPALEVAEGLETGLGQQTAPLVLTRLRQAGTRATAGRETFMGRPELRSLDDEGLPLPPPAPGKQCRCRIYRPCRSETRDTLRTSRRADHARPRSAAGDRRARTPE